MTILAPFLINMEWSNLLHWEYGHFRFVHFSLCMAFLCLLCLPTFHIIWIKGSFPSIPLRPITKLLLLSYLPSGWGFSNYVNNIVVTIIYIVLSTNRIPLLLPPEHYICWRTQNQAIRAHPPFVLCNQPSYRSLLVTDDRIINNINKQMQINLAILSCDNTKASSQSSCFKFISN